MAPRAPSNTRRAPSNARRKSTPRAAACDPRAVAGFDDGALDPAFADVPKPARRALVNAGILTPAQLARWTWKEVAALHGMGPASRPRLVAALAAAGLAFADE